MTSGRGPTGVAAAALYIASVLLGERKTQRDVEDISKKAIDILEKYDKGDCYLTNLTRFLIHRTH